MKMKNGWEILSANDRFEKELPPRPKPSVWKRALMGIAGPLTGSNKKDKAEDLRQQILSKMESLSSTYSVDGELNYGGAGGAHGSDLDPSKKEEIEAMKQQLKDLYKKQK
jgi:hypothetical protein